MPKGGPVALPSVGPLPFVLQPICRIAPFQGAIQMDTWESFFREKSRRRSRPQSIQRAIKIAIVAFTIGELAIAALMLAGGWPP